eukprot:6202260-Pleurochrysis_carterae.AAC.2
MTYAWAKNFADTPASTALNEFVLYNVASVFNDRCKELHIAFFSLQEFAAKAPAEFSTPTPLRITLKLQTPVLLLEHH